MIHLVRGEQPSLPVNKPTRALDPWDIPDDADHLPVSSSRMNSKIMKGLGDCLSSQQIDPKDSTDGNEAERGNNNQWEKQAYFNTCSKDQFENDDEEFWEEQEVQYSVAEKCFISARMCGCANQTDKRRYPV